jgi:hypothetical protein
MSCRVTVGSDMGLGGESQSITPPSDSKCKYMRLSQSIERLREEVNTLRFHL